MGNPVNGTTKIGNTPNTPPVVVAGLNASGQVTPIKVDASGVIQTVPA